MRRHRWYSRSSPVAASLAAVLVGGAFIADASPDGGAPVEPTYRDPRPAVALTVDLVAEDYRNRLAQEADAVADSLAFGVRPALSRFGFLNWAAGTGVARDTISLRLAHSDGRPRHVVLEVTARGASTTNAAVYQTVFETFAETRSRQDWSASAVRREWIDKLGRVLEEKRLELVSQVFGALPIDAQVTLYPEQLQAHIRVQPDSIGAADTPKPRFRLLATISDTSNVLPTRGAAAFVLGGCIEVLGEGTYACQIHTMEYRDSLTAAADRRALLSRAEVVPRTVHLWEYWPAPPRGHDEAVGTRAGGLP